MSAVQEQKAPIGVRPREVYIVAHSMLFYWWPVWAVGLLMAGLTFLDGHRLAVVPPGTKAVEGLQLPEFDGPREALVLPAGERLPEDSRTKAPVEPSLRMAAHSSYRVL